MQAVAARCIVAKRATAVRDTKVATERATRSEKQSEPPQEAHQRAAREIQPMQDPLDHDAARVPLLGDLIMRKPALLLAELVGHSRHQVLRPRDSGLGGRNRVERIACTSHDWCSLSGVAIYEAFPRRNAAGQSTPEIPNAKSRCSVPGIRRFAPRSRGKIA